MHYSVEWLIPQRLILFRFWGNSQVEEALYINETFGKMIEEGQSPVHIIGEVGEKGGIPTDISLLSRRSVLTNEKFGYLLVVGTNAIVRFIATTVTAIIRANVQMANSMDEAYEFLRKTDPTLPRKLSIASFMPNDTKN